MNWNVSEEERKAIMERIAEYDPWPEIAKAYDKACHEAIDAALLREVERLFPHTGTADSSGHGQPL
jgi:hypothetical protein